MDLGSTWILLGIESHSWTVLMLIAIFSPLERVFSIHTQPILRQKLWVDAAFMWGQFLLWGSGTVVVLLWVQGALYEFDLIRWIHLQTHRLPTGILILIGVLFSDLCIYWGHRLSHQVPWLWSIHRVHHTAPALDWVAAYREHPIDHLYTRLIENVPLLILGVPLEALAGFFVFRGLWALWIHSNADLPVGPLKYIFGCPHLHHWHHDEESGGCYNFANLMPLMDLLFGTYYAPSGYPQKYGADQRIRSTSSSPTSNIN